MKKNRIAAIIIAAGYSSRMNSFKPLLKFENGTAIERLVDTYRRFGIEDIYVVVGHRGKEIIEKLKGFEVTFVLNESYPQGMFSSIKKGIMELDKDIDAFFMQPVDIPLIKIQTLERLKNSYARCDKGVFYPIFSEKKGHPPLIDCKYKDRILNSNSDGGLKRVLEVFQEDSLCVPVFDKAILMDMDKKEDYEKLSAYDQQNAPTKEECLEIMVQYHVPDPIIKHCEVVESVACIIYNEVNSCGIYLNEHALFAAARLHDIARKEKNHALLGANMIKSIGYDFVGDIIASHMDIKICEEGPITEKEILYLADKLVKEENICEMDERFGQALQDNRDNPKAIEKINERWLAAKAIIKKIERINGKGFMYE
ncbi:DVU_1551 family NTP transferase [Marinisporobacter balticus]|uniref:Metal dependent phosphohydrolase /molybdenum cofactor cytidylyltransferase n=1 Tax=Marinisporobacter balticus TaxID=2018667 RepID=A0A4R2KHJ0_9FIRM|nr:NTP transferase domain-containing protein [Marinisporobacter balticus]TCO71827.1 metal dependent phosphohydrolase /molybdenum cofactor cytidylyltransferase [Marinisporobacter balticus]